ncbi:O-antigen ligase family protein [Oceanobacillus massiliensis]|uniref:O-antigen ligase family protein n=1 Tax=Oceanobacillus massiliensis TaxID=1465765 RepID=UPI003018ADA3
MQFSTFNSNYLRILRWFIIIQPILDILTTLSIYYIDLSITVGIIVRMLFMLLTLIYIFFGNDSIYKKYVITYLLLLFVVLGIGFIVNMLSKPIFNLFLEVQWIAKIVFFITMFCSFIVIFSSNLDFQKSKMKILKSAYMAMIVVVASIAISIVTNTSGDTYEWVKTGYKGWFFSGNELGAIIAITLPLVFLFAIIKTNSLRDFKFWFLPLALAFTGVFLGTKVGLFAVIGTFVLVFISILLHWISKVRSIGIKNQHTANFVYTVAALIIFLFVLPLTPSVNNLTVDMPIPEKDNIVAEEGEEDSTSEENNENSEEQTLPEQTEDEEARELPAFLDSEIVNKVLSSRHFYFTRQFYQYEDANLLQKFVGMGYAGNYTNTRKTIEMDFLDIFFSFGIIGSILIFLPLLLLIGVLLKRVFTSFTEVIQMQNIMLLTSILLGNGIALIAGHVWFAPAVSIYFSISMVILFYNLKSKETTY